MKSTPYELTRGGRIQDNTATWDDTKPAKVRTELNPLRSIARGGRIEWYTHIAETCIKPAVL